MRLPSQPYDVAALRPVPNYRPTTDANLCEQLDSRPSQSQLFRTAFNITVVGIFGHIVHQSPTYNPNPNPDCNSTNPKNNPINGNLTLLAPFIIYNQFILNVQQKLQ